MDIAKSNVSKLITKEMLKGLSKDIINELVGRDGIIKPNIDKQIWVGNYCITVKVH